MDTASVIGQILNHADEDDLARIIDAVRSRQRTLRQLRAAAVEKGATVTLDGLSPKALNGLHGTVETIRKDRADVRLDADSTRQLAWGRTKFASSARAAGDDGYLLNGVPLGCCAAAS